MRKPPGAAIFLAGQRPTWLFFVASGEAALSRTDRNGRSLVLRRVSRGFLAEASLSSARYHCDAHSLAATELIAFPVTAVRRAIDSDAEVRWSWIGMLAAEIRRQRDSAERLSLKSVRERLLHWLLTEGEDGRFVFRTSRKALAAELGVTHEALYRTIAALVRSGELSDDGKSLRLR
jgi:CRP-like cAMP-binding protein